MRSRRHGRSGACGVRGVAGGGTERERGGKGERVRGRREVYRVTQGDGKTQTSGLTSSRFIRCEARFGSCLKPMRSSQGP
jgi:hypothetical protein